MLYNITYHLLYNITYHVLYNITCVILEVLIEKRSAAVSCDANRTKTVCRTVEHMNFFLKVNYIELWCTQSKIEKMNRSQWQICLHSDTDSPKFQHDFVIHFNNSSADRLFLHRTIIVYMTRRVANK